MYPFHGGIMNNMPVDLMAERFGGGIIIASDVSGEGESPSAEAKAKRPGILEILTQSSMVGGRHATLASLAAGQVSLHLELPVRRFGMLEWAACDALYAAGYDYARQQLASWRPPGRPASQQEPGVLGLLRP